MAQKKRARGLCDVRGCREQAIPGNRYCERCWKRISSVQAFKLDLRSRYLADLEQARQGLLQAQEQGLIEDIRRHEWDMIWLPLAIKRLGDVTVEGSISLVALPERKA